MNDPITQARLSMRLDRYMNDYSAKKIKEDNPDRERWAVVSQEADSARVKNNLTPEILDDVRVALDKL